jgi:hypothetical protein
MAGSSACRDPIAQLNRNFHRGRGHTLRLLSVDQIGYRRVCYGKDLVLRYDAVTLQYLRAFAAALVRRRNRANDVAQLS